MRKLLLMAGMLAGCVVAAGAAGAAGDFTRSMSAEEISATGLGKLSAGELERLKAVVERYKSGEVAVVQQRAAAQVAAVEAKLQETEAKAAAEEARGPGWLKALVTLKRVEAKPDNAVALEARLEGELRSFEGQRRFVLDNGQVWRMTESNYYSGPVLKSPVVRIKPGMLGVFWLEIPAAGRLRMKVLPVKLE